MDCRAPQRLRHGAVCEIPSCKRPSQPLDSLPSAKREWQSVQIAQKIKQAIEEVLGAGREPNRATRPAKAEHQQFAKGHKADDFVIVRRYRKAAEDGDTYGMINLGQMYEHGWCGLPKDEAQAVNWYRKAADEGDEDAKAHLKRVGY